MEIDFTPQQEPRAPYRSCAADSSTAVLFLHGFTGSPASWVPIARALTGEGIDVSVPLLPGHGTKWQEMVPTTWSDWLGAALSELDGLQARHERVVVAGLSMGGALALALGTAPVGPDELIVINPGLHIDSPLAPLLPALRHVVPTIPSIGGDIDHPGRDEYAYERTPLAPLVSYNRGLRTLREDLWKIDVPVTALISGRDGIVGPKSLRTLRAGLPHPPTIIGLRRSRHVATLDFDAATIAEVVLARARALPVSASHAGSNGE